MSSAETVRPSDLSATVQQDSALARAADGGMARQVNDEKVPVIYAPLTPTTRLTTKSLAPAPSQAGSAAPSVRPFSRAPTAQATPPRQPKPLLRPVPTRPNGSQPTSRPLIGGHNSSSRSGHGNTAYPAPALAGVNRTQSSSPSVLGRPPPNPPSHGASFHRDAPQGPGADELIAFAALCRQLYYDKDPAAARVVESTLAKLSAGSRQAYARTMAGVRSQFHLDEAHARRRAVVDALAGAAPVLGGNTAAQRRSKAARRARADRLSEFVKAYCIKGMPGAHPFCRALHGVLSLQALAPRLGGPGRRRVEWEVDVAVLTEASGGDWMKDSIALLKTVLGFDELLKESETDTFFDDDNDFDDDAALVPDSANYDYDESDRDEPSTRPISPPNATGAPRALLNRPRSDSSPLDPDVIPTTAAIEVRTGSHTKRQPPAVPPHRAASRPPPVQRAAEEETDRLRERSVSDPFLDPGDRRRPILPVSVSFGDEPLAQSTTPPPLPARHHASSPMPASPTSAPLLGPTSSQSNLNPAAIRPPRARRPSAGPGSGEPVPQFRIFTAPSWLTDPELRALAGLFPEWARLPKAGLIKLAASAGGGGGGRVDEEGAVEGDEGLSRSTSSASSGVGRGHGEIRVSGGGLREEGWRGTGWERFVGWWRSLFGTG